MNQPYVGLFHTIATIPLAFQFGYVFGENERSGGSHETGLGTYVPARRGEKLRPYGSSLSEATANQNSKVANLSFIGPARGPEDKGACQVEWRATDGEGRQEGREAGQRKVRIPLWQVVSDWAGHAHVKLLEQSRTLLKLPKKHLFDRNSFILQVV